MWQDRTLAGGKSYDLPMPEGPSNSFQSCTGCGGDLAGVRHEGRCPFCRARVPENIGVRVPSLSDFTDLKAREVSPPQPHRGLVNCIACGYNIQELTGRVERCPECGTKLAEMVGEFFAGCSHQYIQFMLLGIRFFVIVHAGAVLLPLFVVSMTLSAGARVGDVRFKIAAAFVLIVPATLAWVALRYLTMPHPVFDGTSERRDRYKKARLFARRGAHAWFGAAIVLSSLSIVSIGFAVVAILYALVITVLIAWTSVRYFGMIADCCADVSVAKSVRRMGKLAPVFVFVPPLAIVTGYLIILLGSSRISMDATAGAFCCIPIAGLVGWGLTMGVLSEVSLLLQKQARAQTSRETSEV